MNCKVTIKREPRMAFSAQPFQIYVDGTVVATVKSGKTADIFLTPGTHDLSLGIGRRIATSITVTIAENAGALTVFCWIESNGMIEAKLSDNNIPHSIDRREDKVQSAAINVIVRAVVGLAVLYIILRLLF